MYHHETTVKQVCEHSCQRPAHTSTPHTHIIDSSTYVAVCSSLPYYLSFVHLHCLHDRCPRSQNISLATTNHGMTSVVGPPKVLQGIIHLYNNHSHTSYHLKNILRFRHISSSFLCIKFKTTSIPILTPNMIW